MLSFIAFKVSIPIVPPVMDVGRKAVSTPSRNVGLISTPVVAFIT
jgi:hypothetical protein